MKVFSTGLQRTGTMSLTRALNRIGFRAKQFPKELYQDIQHPIINEYDAFTDFPIPLLYQALDQAYPGSKFIHTIRDEDKWLKSVRWLFTTGRIKFNVTENNYAQTFHQHFYGTTHFDEAVFLTRYRAYNKEVAAYFADRPEDYLVINLTEGEGYEKICPFLGVPVPDQPFPYSNKSEGSFQVRLRKFRRQTMRRVRRAVKRTPLRPLSLVGKGVVSPLRLTSSPERLSCTPFFILSSGRSGSTLLRAILNQHPTLCIPPESHRLGPIVQQFNQNYRYLSWNFLPSLVAADFQKERGFAFWELDLAPFYKMAADLPPNDHNLAKLIDVFYNYYIRVHKPDAIRWGDKTTRNAQHLPQLDALYPTAQYIHIVRDGRDVAVSLFEQGLQPNPPAAAEHWLKLVSGIREFGANLPDGRFLEVIYEELAHNPEQTIRKVCEFLSSGGQPVDYRPDMLAYWQNVEMLGDADRDLHSNLKNKINSNAIGKWEKKLNSSQKALVEERLGPMLTQLGYK